MVSPIDALREPAYTGERRCWPCTVVNIALLAIGAFTAGVVLSWLGAAVLAVAGLVVIWLRGYLVPYTPTFAPRLAGRLPYDPFHTDGGRPEAGADSSSLAESGQSVDGERLMGALLEAGVLTVDGETEDLLLADSVRTEWQSAIEEYAAMEPAELGARIRVLSGAATVETVSEADEVWYHLRDDDGAISGGGILSRAVAITEVSAYETLGSWIDDSDIRMQAVEPLRMFLDTCPICGVGLEETDTLDCCGGAVNPKQEPRDVLACPDCGRKLYTFPA